MSVEKQLVLDDRTADGRAELILIQERLSDTVFVVEPIAGRERVVSVGPVCRAVEDVASRGRSEGDLRRSSADRRVGVRRRNGEFGDLVQDEPVRLITQP